jgi:hypothetical protein
MRLQNVKILASILLLSQLRGRGEKGSWGFLRRPRALLVVDLVVLFGAFVFAFSIMNVVPLQDFMPIQLMATQLLASVPMIVLLFMVIYGIFFVIGETAQFSSSEMVNYMPISATEYVLASSLSAAFMYLYILTAVLGITLALALKLNMLAIWTFSALLSSFFMVVGGFVSEIIRAIVNRVSSSFSKRGGRSAIISRAILIVFVLVISQLFFNPNILYSLIGVFAPQIYVLWFIPVIWPSIVVMELANSNLLGAAVFSCLTVAFGFALMGLGVYLRSRYWVPLPVTIKLSSSKGGGYRSRGVFGMLGFSQAESAIISKDARSLFRRKEMVRFWSIPIIMIIPILLTTGSMNYYEKYEYTAMICLIGAGILGLFLSVMSVGQEGRAVWNLFSSPINARSLFRAKVALPLSISLIIAFIFPVAFSAIFRFGFNASVALLTLTLIGTTITVLVGCYFGARYPDLEERPRSSYVTGTGMLLSFLVAGVMGLAFGTPFMFYAFAKQFALSIGMNFLVSLVATVVVGMVLIAVLFRASASAMSRFFRESPI